MTFDTTKLRSLLAALTEYPWDVDTRNAIIARLPALLDEIDRLRAALDGLFTDMIITQGNMRDAAKHDPRWEGCAEAIQPRVDAAHAALNPPAPPQGEISEPPESK